MKTATAGTAGTAGTEGPGAARVRGGAGVTARPGTPAGNPRGTSRAFRVVSIYHRNDAAGIVALQAVLSATPEATRKGNAAHATG